MVTIGKALTHEVEGSHALIGAEIARKYGESDDVAHAIEAHHNEEELTYPGQIRVTVVRESRSTEFAR